VISANDRRKLVRYLGMIGSEHDGEALNAARIALRLLKERGLTWDEILAPGVPEHVIEGAPAANPAAAARPQRKQAKQPQQQATNPWYFIAGDLMNAMTKKKRVAAVDLSLVVRAQNPLYEPTYFELIRLRDLYKAHFGADKAQAQAS
jgi:hypothetical protein